MVSFWFRAQCNRPIGSYNSGADSQIPVTLAFSSFFCSSKHSFLARESITALQHTQQQKRARVVTPHVLCDYVIQDRGSPFSLFSAHMYIYHSQVFVRNATDQSGLINSDQALFLVIFNCLIMGYTRFFCKFFVIQAKTVQKRLQKRHRLAGHPLKKGVNRSEKGPVWPDGKNVQKRTFSGQTTVLVALRRHTG